MLLFYVKQTPFSLIISNSNFETGALKTREIEHDPTHVICLRFVGPHLHEPSEHRAVVFRRKGGGVVQGRPAVAVDGLRDGPVRLLQQVLGDLAVAVDDSLILGGG
jgi:hypothetical protein